MCPGREYYTGRTFSASRGFLQNENRTIFGWDMAKNVQKPRRPGVKKGGGTFIGCVASIGEFTVSFDEGNQFHHKRFRCKKIHLIHHLFSLSPMSEGSAKEAQHFLNLIKTVVHFSCTAWVGSVIEVGTACRHGVFSLFLIRGTNSPDGALLGQIAS